MPTRWGSRVRGGWRSGSRKIWRCGIWRGGARPDYWALNDFRRRQKGGVNEVFTQVVELARSLGMGKLGHVAIDSTRIAANAAADSVETEEKLRGERAKIRKQIRRWQRQCEAEDPNEGA